MNDDKKFFIGLLSGMLCMGVKRETKELDVPKLEDIMVMDFHPDAKELKMLLQNPLPFNFINKKTQQLQRMSVALEDFTYLLNLEDVEDTEKLIMYYKECILKEEQEARLRKQALLIQNEGEKNVE